MMKNEETPAFDGLPEEMAEAVTAWFGSVKKSLPWREDPAPYTVWISEIMLQQTRIEAVIPYYRRFLEAFPDIFALAAAEEDEVLKMWEGLGYYSRARNLHRTAKLLAEGDGSFPADAEQLRKLPGIGDYTAGAIASIAFGLPEPAVDGNVLRVLTRYLACGIDVTLPAAKKEAAEALRRIYPVGRAAGELTEGLMELGEEVCIPNGEAKCALCPLRESCAAHLSGREDEFPVRTEKKPRRTEDRTVLILRDADGRTAIRRRGRNGLLAGMWEYPNREGWLSAEEVLARLAESGIAVDAADMRELSPTRHIFTHVEWRMRWYEASCVGFGNVFTSADERELREKYALPTAFRRK